MALTNSKLVTTSYALSAGGVSGFSMVALSYVLSSPNDLWNGATFTVAITNDAPTAPLLVEVRTAWQGMNGASCVTPLAVDRISNNQSFGNSGALPVTATLLTSGRGGTLTYTGVAGSAIQVVIMSASSLADAQGCSGSISLWRAM